MARRSETEQPEPDRQHGCPAALFSRLQFRAKTIFHQLGMSQLFGRGEGPSTPRSRGAHAETVQASLMRDLREQQRGGAGEVAVASTLWTTLGRVRLNWRHPSTP